MKPEKVDGWMDGWKRHIHTDQLRWGFFSITTQLSQISNLKSQISSLNKQNFAFNVKNNNNIRLRFWSQIHNRSSVGLNNAALCAV